MEYARSSIPIKVGICLRPDFPRACTHAQHNTHGLSTDRIRCWWSMRYLTAATTRPTGGPPKNGKIWFGGKKILFQLHITPACSPTGEGSKGHKKGSTATCTYTVECVPASCVASRAPVTCEDGIFPLPQRLCRKCRAGCKPHFALRNTLSTVFILFILPLWGRSKTLQTYPILRLGNL